jgi:hypothetical protein
MSEIEPKPTWDTLRAVVAQATYRPDWHMGLTDVYYPPEHEVAAKGQGNRGLRLDVRAIGYDSYHSERGQTYRVRHSFIVPAASYNATSWTRWLLDRLIDIETHECCEFLVVDGKRPFAPNHGPGHDPYQLRELNTAEAAETTFRGERREGTQ